MTVKLAKLILDALALGEHKVSFSQQPVLSVPHLLHLVCQRHDLV